MPNETRLLTHRRGLPRVSNPRKTDMQNPKAPSFKPLTISASDLPALRDRLDQQDKLTSYAAERAKLLLGCYRTGEANDPQTYVAAITAVLSRFPEEVM